MAERIEQRYIRFCYKLHDTQVPTIWKSQHAIGDEAMGMTQIKECYNRFKQEWTSVEDIHGQKKGIHWKSVRSSTSRKKAFIENFRQLVKNHRLIIIKYHWRSRNKYRMLYDENKRKRARRVTGTFTVTTHLLILFIWSELLWPKTALHLYEIFSTHQKWHLATSGSCLNCKQLLKGSFLSRENKLRAKRRYSSTSSQWWHSRDVTNSYRTGGKGVCTPESSTFKVIE